jgi:FkbM family methyltransferase
MHCDIERFGEKCFAFINQSRREDAWFSHRAQLRTLLERCDVNLVLDAGANEGQFVQEVRAFYPGEIHSFEPVASVFAKLAKAASSDTNWHVHQYALGSQESVRSINVSNRTVFSSMLKTNDYCSRQFGNLSLGTREEVVAVRRLDNVLNEIIPKIEGKRIFLKMDTQGFDLEVFAGLGDALSYVCALQSEVSLVPIYEGIPHWLETISAYEKKGFGVVGMFPVVRDSNRVIEYDCVLVRGHV